MTEKYLTLWLEGPLQSWGSDSLFGRRDTLNFPTLSGVMGLLCSAMGRGGEEREFLSGFADRFWHVNSYQSKDKEGNLIPIVRLEDFHMVGSAYDDSDKWQKLNIPKTSESKTAVGGGAKLTYRYYLQNASFGVVMGFPAELAIQIESAMLAPVWSIFLGRKNCIPSEIVFQGIFDTKDRALTRIEEIANFKDKEKSFCVTSQITDVDEIVSLNDVPVQFGDRKQYRSRQIGVSYGGV